VKLQFARLDMPHGEQHTESRADHLESGG